MKNYLFLFTLLAQSLFAEGAITYEFSGGRFGDNVLAYLHAKWLSHHYQIPLLYRPFKYSSKLNLDKKELNYHTEFMKYRRCVILDRNYPTPTQSSDVLFVCRYFPEIKWELSRGNYFSFTPEWNQPAFRQAVREMISLQEPLPLTLPPEGVLSVAMHLRDGGDFDDYEHHFKHPLKTPPISYYIESMQLVRELFNNAPIYCYVFTDATNPEPLVAQIQKAFPEDAQITFNYRTENNHHDENVLEDFFSLFCFDVLIRAESNYSIVPALIHDYAVVIAPESFSIHDRVVTINDIKIDKNEQIYQEKLNKYCP